MDVQVVQLKVLRQSFIHLNDMGQRHSGKAIRTHGIGFDYER
ncbi:hypothetical protein BRARA_E02407 [Brassica rapa]|uniref:Uncharacterized protein n=1 Tax=Brassica campestris TaxID=3711 RepID=A0A397ZK20_BRACM|nr:hypothetical protein BRARA_E02407 [Brassica rapa]